MKAFNLICFVLISTAFAKYKTGAYESKDDWRFLDKFCFEVSNSILIKAKYGCQCIHSRESGVHYL